MVHPKPRDLVAVEHDARYYYAIVLSKQIMAGGQLVFALYRTSQHLEPKEIVLNTPLEGFHFITDFIFAKRRGLLHRVAANVPIGDLDSFKYYRQEDPSYGWPDRTWAIWDRALHVVKTPQALTVEEWSYPVATRFDHVRMCERIEERWKPEHDRQRYVRRR